MLQALAKRELQIWRELPDLKEFPDQIQYVIPGNERFMANQGAIYVDPQVAGIGYRMVTFSLPGLKVAGADYALMHHRMLGRGARLGVWFRRLRATLITHEYYLWLRD